MIPTKNPVSLIALLFVATTLLSCGCLDNVKPGQLAQEIRQSLGNAEPATAATLSKNTPTPPPSMQDLPSGAVMVAPQATASTPAPTIAPTTQLPQTGAAANSETEKNKGKPSPTPTTNPSASPTPGPELHKVYDNELEKSMPETPEGQLTQIN